MTSDYLLDAIGDIADEYIAEALSDTMVSSLIDEENSATGFTTIDENVPAVEHLPSKGKFSYTLRWFSAIAAIFCIILAGYIGTTYYRTPVAYLSVDVNPSIQLSLNRWNYIVGVETFNKEGETICEHLKLKNKACHTAFEHLFGDEEFAHFVEKNGDLTVTIVADGAEKTEKLTTIVESAAKEHHLETTCHTADRDSLEKAHNENCSVGKYQIWTELHSYDETYEIQDCKDMSIHEINEKIENCKKTEKDGQEEASDHQGEWKQENSADEKSKQLEEGKDDEKCHEAEDCHTISEGNKPKVPRKPKSKPKIPKKVARSHRVSGSYKAKKEQEREAAAARTVTNEIVTLGSATDNLATEFSERENSQIVNSKSDCVGSENLKIEFVEEKSEISVSEHAEKEKLSAIVEGEEE